MSDSNKLAWFLAGAAMGATAALLLAPQSGEETRRYIVKSARRGSRRAAAMGRDAVNQGRDLYERGKELAEDAAEALEHSVDRARRTFQG